MRKGLNIGASSVGGIVTNNGILSLGAGTLSKDVNSKNGTVNVIGDVSATSNVETKTFSVADGASYATTDQASLSISTSADLKGTLEASGTSTVTLNEGVALSFGFNGKFILTGSSVVLDSKNLIKSDYSSNFGKNVEGGSGTLALRLEGGSEASPREYTEEEYNKTKEALFGDDVAIAEAKLTFIYGTIKLKEGQTIVIGGKTETSSDRIVIDGNTPVLANNSETVKDANINLVYEPNKFVRVVDETQTVDKPTLKASKIEIQNTAFVVKGLEVAEATESVSVTLTENATITLTGGDDADKSVVAKNGEQAEVVTDFVVKDQSTLNFGLANNSNNQKASVKSVIVEKGGTHNVAGNGLEKTNFSYESLSIGEAGTSENAANVSVTNAQLKVNKLAANSGIIYVDPAYLEAAELSGDTFGAALLVSSGSVVNIGTEIAEIKKALEKAGINPTVISEGLTLDSNQSMLAINGNVNLGTTGQIVVDAKVDDTGKIGGLTVSDAVHFGDGSLLAVNGAQIQTKAAITAAGGAKAFIGDTAKLYIANAQAGGKYFILDVDGDIAGSKKGWTGDNLLTDSDIVGAIFHYVEEDGNEKGWVSVTSKPANEAYPNLDGELVKLVNNLYGNGINDVYSDTAGVRFLSRATNKAFLGADSKAGTQAIESAARIAMAGAVP